MGNSGYEMLVLSLLEKPDLVSSMNISSEASYHVLWVPSRLFWPWLREGLGTESSFITSIRGWDQCPEWPCPAKSIPSWAAARSRAVRGIWTQVKWESVCVYGNASGKNTQVLVPVYVHIHHNAASLTKFSPGKFGNDNNNNGGFAVCPRVGLSENRTWTWEAERSGD